MSPRVGHVVGTAVLAVVAALSAGCAGSQASQGGPDGSDNRFVSGDGSVKTIGAADRKGAPKVEGSTIEGRAFKAADLGGKVVVVNFWASWCAPCRGEAPTLEKLYEENRPKGVEFLGVDIKDAKEPAKAFQRGFKVSYPSLFDPDGRITLAFRDVPPNAVPSTLILDRRGRIAVRIIGGTTYSKLSPLIHQIAAEK